MRAIYIVVLCCAIGLAITWIRNRQKGILRVHDRNMIGFGAFVGAMIGAKLPFLLESGWDGIWQGSVWFADGKTILGGIFGGYLTVELVKWFRSIRTSTGDSFAVPVALAVAMGRLGCFVAGCCYGTPTQLPWGIHFPQAKDPIHIVRHPIQLYEIAFHLAWVIGLLLLERKQWLCNHRLKLYLLCYLVFRFVTEWIRPETRYWLGLTLYQYASVLLFTLLATQWIVQANAPKSTVLAD